MDDQSILQHISELVAEEKQILEEEGKEGRQPQDHERLGQLQVTLDQCWDLLRQRRARREYGRDPDTAIPRDPSTVEHYSQ